MRKQEEKEQKKIYEATKVSQQNKKNLLLLSLISQSHKYFRHIYYSYHQNVCLQFNFCTLK